MKAMILAAGLGTRLKPLTESKPKALIEINQVPLIEYVVKRLMRNGYTDIVVNLHHFGDQIIRFFEQKKNFGINICFSDETSQLLDTGGGILKARWFLDGKEPFLVYNVDVLSDIDLENMLDFHLKKKPVATLAVRDRDTFRKLVVGNDSQLCEWVNLKSGERKTARICEGESNLFAFSGIQLIEPEIFKLITESGPFSVMDLYLRLAKDFDIKCFVHNEGYWFDLGKYQQVIDFEKANTIDFTI
jgi:NDP-sugar pyrophosphorylase family protein